MNASVHDLTKLAFFILLLMLLYPQRNESIYSIKYQNETEQYSKISGHVKTIRDKKKNGDPEYPKDNRHSVSKKNKYFRRVHPCA